jgi:hypothetical protein
MNANTQESYAQISASDHPGNGDAHSYESNQTKRAPNLYADNSNSTQLGADSIEKSDNHVKICQFNPEDIEWFNYKNYFEAIGDQSNLSNRTKCSKLLGALPNSLMGVVTGLNTRFTYKDLVSRIDDSQTTVNAREDAQIRLNYCIKDPKEQIALFAERVRQLTERAYPHYAETDKDSHAVQAFIHGMAVHSEISYQLRVKVFKSLKEAVKFALRVENSRKPLLKC